MNELPLISVIMPCYNREKYVVEAIESILNQTYSNFEFIIIDDCSTDNTFEVVKEYAKKDNRIIALRNDKNYSIVHSLNKGIKLARGKYIARMDDDDISLPKRFEKQVEFLENNEDVIVLGTFIKVFTDDMKEYYSWITETNPEVIKILINFFNPICHPSVMIRKSFLEEKKLTYAKEYEFAEEYYLWNQIIQNGGKIVNLSDILLKFRTHHKRISENKNSSNKMNDLFHAIRLNLLNRIFGSGKAKKIEKAIIGYPFENNNKLYLYNLLKQIKNINSYKKYYSDTAIEYIIDKYCGVKSDMHIFFSCDDNYSKYLFTAIASILKNSLPIDNFNFYILDGGISKHNKDRIKKLTKIKNFNIEFIKIDNKLFEDCYMNEELKYISKATYYRYIIPRLKPNLKKCLYLDVDIIVVDSLNQLWNTNIDNYYIGGVKELWDWYNEYFYDSFKIYNTVNCGVLLINLEKWINNDITNKLFHNTDLLIKYNKIKYQDQDVINYTFKDNILFISPRYNLQQTAYFKTHYNAYSDNEMYNSKMYPVIIHYSGNIKPWQKGCLHPLWGRYYEYTKLFWYQKIFYIINNNKFKVVNILGIKISIKKSFLNFLYNKYEDEIYKRITILGIKITYKNKFKFLKKQIYEEIWNSENRIKWEIWNRTNNIINNLPILSFDKVSNLLADSSSISVSVIITVYNIGKKYLINCIESVINQTLKNTEIIIVNDCSEFAEDESICLEYANKDSRIKYIKHKENMGYTASIMTGLNHANGHAITFVDADDYIDLHALEMAFNKLTINNVDIVSFDYSIVNGDMITNVNKNIPLLYINTENILGAFSNNLIYAKLFSYMYRKDILLKLEKYIINNTIGEDLLLCFQIFDKSKSMINLPTKLYYYNARPNSLNNKKINYIENISLLFNGLKEYVINNNKEYSVYLTRLFARWAIQNSYYEIYYNSNSNKDKEKVYINILRSIFDDLIDKNMVMKYLKDDIRDENIISWYKTNF